ncbi:GPI-anchored wall transfer protein 1-like [Cotesia glomerata]|uniref:GPI-anchored wall transfer protein 1-like n=1 Tax=Cotesia glomerata TaxID=32391 RepID=UPI001D015993|nr:GPI-anchored wall transfer protein 1-like [Cotesia glomerata]
MRSITDEDEQRYRRAQQEFISNLGGSAPQEIIIVILPSILTILLLSTITSVLSNKTLINNKIVRNFLPIVEFIITITPSILSLTILSDYTLIITLVIIITIMINYSIIYKFRNKLSVNINNNLNNCKNSGRKHFLTNFRALTNILTCICILAVDFKIFPRKFAKTEIYGYSLMDAGVGMFIIANAIVSPQTKDFTSNNSNNSNKHLRVIRKFALNAKKCTKDTAPLLILGIGRILAVEYSDYQKHVSEYGVHWNFFLTLAFVKIFISTITSAISSRFALISGLWILVMHEYALNTKGLKEWLLGDTPRNDFVSANREGIVSVPGYVGLYLVGIALGRLIYSTYDNSENNNGNYGLMKRFGVNMMLLGRKVSFEYTKAMVLCVKLSIIAPQACGLVILNNWLFGVSRRMANFGYCAWVITLSTILLTLLLLVEILIDILIFIVTDGSKEADKSKDSAKKRKNVKFDDKFMNDCSNKDISEEINLKCPTIFQAVNYNGLVFFLISNLLTGIVNLRIKTLYVNEYNAIFLICSYVAICIFSVFIFYRYNIKLKL